MSDIGNVLVRHGKSAVFLSTASAGGSLPVVVRGALARRERWNDGPYLARIVFCQMIRLNEVDADWAADWRIDGTLGYGISSRLDAAGDAAHPVIALNADTQDVLYLTVEAASRIGEGATGDVSPLAAWSMSDYVAGRGANPGCSYRVLSSSGRFREC